MSASFDTTAAVQSTSGNGSAANFSLSITPSSAGSTVILLVADDPSFAKALSGTPTCGGSAMTEIGTALSTGNYARLRVFRLENQPASARTVSGTWNGNGSAADSPWQAIAFAINGAHTTNALGAGGGTTTGFGADSLAITGASTSLNVAILLNEAATNSASAVSPGTKRFDHDVSLGGDNIYLAVQTFTGSGASQTASFTLASDDQTAFRTFEIVTAAASGNVTVTPTGQAVTSSLGSAPAGVMVLPAGQSITSALGTPTASTQSTVTVTPTGFSVASSLGTFGTEADIMVAPTGGLLSMSLGTPTTSGTTGDVNVVPLGFAVTVAQGAPTVMGDAVVPVVGFNLTLSRGTPTVVFPALTIQPQGFVVQVQSNSVKIVGPSSGGSHFVRASATHGRRSYITLPTNTDIA